MVEHNADYFIAALKQLNWNREYTGNELVNLFSNFPIGWFVHVPLDETFRSWEDFWVYLTPISESTQGPRVHEEQAKEFCQEEAQRESSGWGR